MQMTPYFLKEALLAKTHNLRRLTCQANAVGAYHYLLLCLPLFAVVLTSFSVRTDRWTDGSTVTNAAHAV